MEQLVRFIIASEAGLDLAQFPRTPSVTLFESARRTGWSDDPDDPGGATMCGVTLATYAKYCSRRHYPAPTKQTLRAIPFAHWQDILKSLFWDRCGADFIKDKGVAYLIVDWVWASGPKVLKNVQRLVSTVQDGIIGPKTLRAINDAGHALKEQIRIERVCYIERICRRSPVLRKYRKGWLNRINRLDSLNLGI